MEPMRQRRDDELVVMGKGLNSTLLAAETLRIADTSNRESSPSPKGEDRISVFWRIFGGTLLSIAALVCITIYQQFTSGMNDLRANVNRITESRGDFVKNEDFNNRLLSMWTTIKDLQAANAALSVLKERSSLLEQQLKTGQEESKEMSHELQRLRERLAAIEGRQTASAPVPSSTPPRK